MTTQYISLRKVYIIFIKDIEKSAVNKKAKEALKKLSFTVDKVITPSESAK